MSRRIENVTSVAADVRDLESLARALPTDLDAALEREEALKRSGMPFIIVRAPRLTDATAEGTHVLPHASTHKLRMKDSVSRTELVRLMVESVDAAGSHGGETWDVVNDRRA